MIIQPDTGHIWTCIMFRPHGIVASCVKYIITGFGLGVALTLGLGIGATTTIYSVVDGVILSPLPFDDPEGLVAVGTTFPTREWVEGADGLQHLAGTSVANYMDLEQRARSFQSLAAVERMSVLLPDEGQGPQLATAARVSPEFFDVLRVSPALGRTFLPEEYRDGSEAAFLLTHGAWQRRFGGDPNVVGSSLARVGTAASIVGVLPADFALPETVFPTMPDFFAPLQPDHARYADRGMRSVYIFGRLSAGTSVELGACRGHADRCRAGARFPGGKYVSGRLTFRHRREWSARRDCGHYRSSFVDLHGRLGAPAHFGRVECGNAASRPGARPCA